MAKSPTDPRRARVHELITELGDHLGRVRDYALTPGSTWLAKGEIEAMARLTNELEEAIEEVRRSETA